MPTPTLDEAVREHYRAHRLTDDSLAALRREIHAAAPEPSPEASGAARTPRRAAADRGPAARAATARRLWRGAAAGALTLALAGVIALAWPAGGAMTTEAVAREIALNHVQALDPDVRGASFEAVAGQLGKLDFAPVRPDHVGMDEVIGGRYCSLGGEMAAQIRFVDAKDRVCTLYQVRDTGAFEGVQEGTFDTSGVRVHVWREGGVLVGLAEPMPEGE